MQKRCLGALVSAAGTASLSRYFQQSRKYICKSCRYVPFSAQTILFIKGSWNTLPIRFFIGKAMPRKPLDKQVVCAMYNRRSVSRRGEPLLLRKSCRYVTPGDRKTGKAHLCKYKSLKENVCLLRKRTSAIFEGRI